MKTAIGILLLLIPFLVFFVIMWRLVGFWQTVIMLFGAVLVTAMIVVGTCLLTGKL